MVVISSDLVARLVEMIVAKSWRGVAQLRVDLELISNDFNSKEPCYHASRGGNLF